jgi:hypothetical protein
LITHLRSQHRFPQRQRLGHAHQKAELHDTGRCGNECRQAERVDGARAPAGGRHVESASEVVQGISNLLSKPEIRRIESRYSTICAHLRVAITKRPRRFNL